MQGCWGLDRWDHWLVHPPPGLGTLIGRAVGSRLGGMAGRAAATALQDHINSMKGPKTRPKKLIASEGTAAEDEAWGLRGKMSLSRAANDTKHALYNNKRDPNNPSGFHGYLDRMIEQMWSRRPRTPSWDRHVDELKGTRRKLADAYEPFQADAGETRVRSKSILLS